jgi:tetratricopeptide (TPR) repeat protein
MTLDRRQSRAGAGAAAALLCGWLLALPSAAQAGAASQSPQSAPVAVAPAPRPPAGAAASLESARAAYDRGDCAEALPGLEAAAAARPQDAVLHYQLGFCLERERRSEEAKEHKRKATALFETQAAAGKNWEPFYYLAALAAQDLDDAERARIHAQEGLALLPAPQRMDGVACFRASRMAKFAGRPEEEATWMRQAAERFMKQPSPPAVYAAEALISAGQGALDKGENAPARDFLERAASLTEGARGAWYLGGVARLRLGDAGGALENFRRLNEEPERTEAQYAVRLMERVPALKDLPGALPDSRVIKDLSISDFGAALRPACAGEWKEASRPAALALLVELLRRGQPLRETVLSNGCVDLLFR